MLEEKRDDSNVDDQVQLLLQEAGLDSVPIDPVSLDALKSLMSANDDFSNSGYLIPEESSTVRATDENCPPLVSSSIPPMSVVKPNLYELRRYTSELTSPSSAPESIEDDASIAMAASFTKIEGATPVENEILEQLHRQTRLLVEMQRRIDELAATVEHLTRGGGPIPPRPPMSYPPNPPPAVSRPAPPTTTPLQPTTLALPTPTPPVQPRAPAVPVPNNNNNNDIPARGGLLMAIRNSSLVKIVYLLWALRRRYVQELDGGLIFKIVFMMAILTARMSSSSKKHGDPEWHKKFAILVLLIVTGFLLQTGYLQYFYTFFVKENFPERVFNGEDINEIIRNPAAPPQNADDNNNNRNNNNNPGAPPLPRGQFPPNHHPARPGPAAAAAAGGWRNTFLGGMIPEADQGGVAGAVKDVAILLGSFLLSIFPMWAPEGPPPRRAPPPPEGGLAVGPGEVRPPRDVLQPADDSDEEVD